MTVDDIMMSWRC